MNITLVAIVGIVCATWCFTLWIGTKARKK